MSNLVIQATALYCGEKVYITEVSNTSYGKTRVAIVYDGITWLDIDELNNIVWLPELPTIKVKG